MTFTPRQVETRATPDASSDNKQNPGAETPKKLFRTRAQSSQFGLDDLLTQLRLTTNKEKWMRPLQALVVLDYELIIDRRTVADV